MKTLKITFASLALVLFTFAGKADGKKVDEKMSMTYAVKTFVNAFSHGKASGISEIFDDNVKLTTSRGSKIVTYSKSDILQMLKNTNGVEQNCKTSYSVIENLPSQVIVKVNQAYDSFTKINYVTMAQTDKGWKITNISSAFQ
ncbi:MAG: hypothetical protein K0S09_917 [Sphingobacteriaceae bacterium]|jgi:hypothetical protein|nr:hypothetical protein [Sphingobacteriaceae bacterium]